MSVDYEVIVKACSRDLLAHAIAIEKLAQRCSRWAGNFETMADMPRLLHFDVTYFDVDEFMTGLRELRWYLDDNVSVAWTCDYDNPSQLHVRHLDEHPCIHKNCGCSHKAVG